jgi:hypothetical protein
VTRLIRVSDTLIINVDEIICIYAISDEYGPFNSKIIFKNGVTSIRTKTTVDDIYAAIQHTVLGPRF